MQSAYLLLILLVNVLIGVWNCYAAGTAWKDVMAMGSSRQKAVLWAGVVQAAIGFSLPILLVLLWLALTLNTGTGDAMFTPDEARAFTRAALDLWYVVIIFPALGSGLVLTIHSIKAASQQRDFSSIATAGWNTYAQVRNTVNAVRHLGGALGNVGEFLGKVAGSRGKAKGKAIALLIALVVIALLLGTIIALGLVRYFANRTESRLEEYAKANLPPGDAQPA